MSKNRLPVLLLISSRFHPIVPAAVFFALIMGILTLIFKIEGISIILDNYKPTALFSASFSYIIFVTRFIHNAHEKDFERLLGNSEFSDEDKKVWVTKMGTHRSQWIEILVAIVIGLVHAYLQGSSRIFNGETKFLIYDIWRSFQVVLVWVMVTMSTSIFIRNMTLINELSTQIKIDLLNMERFMPLTRSGVWSILSFVGLYSIIFARGMANITLADPAILVLGPTIYWMIRTPLKGFRKRVTEAKEAELKVIDAAIEGDHEALKESRISANLDNINVIDLINYKKMIQSTFEIPVNIPTASRFVFYLIIPLLTWIAASMVDKVIDYLIK